MSREDFQPGREASKGGTKATCSYVSVCPCQTVNASTSLGLRGKARTKKEAERGQGSAYHQEELSEIHRFSLIAEAKLPGLACKPHRIRSHPSVLSQPALPQPWDPSPPLPLPLLFTQLGPSAFMPTG